MVTVPVAGGSVEARKHVRMPNLPPLSGGFLEIPLAVAIESLACQSEGLGTSCSSQSLTQDRRDGTSIGSVLPAGAAEEGTAETGSGNRLQDATKIIDSGVRLHIVPRLAGAISARGSSD